MEADAMRHGFVKVAAATPDIRVADVAYNVEQIKKQMDEADEQGAKVVVFPELCLTGYTCGDLFGQEILLKAVKEGLRELTEYTKEKDGLYFVGAPAEVEGKLYNVAAAMNQGRLLGLTTKSFLPNYGEFYEMRQFTQGPRKARTVLYDGREVPFGPQLLFEARQMEELVVSAEVCEDVWCPVPPSIEAARAGENGKGFAVVAEQIRELADQSRESTEHINQIVNGLIENSNISVETAKKVSEAFEKQDAKIKDTEAIFATLNSEINRVGSAVSGIAAEASDLEQHKNTIAYGVDNLAQFAEENASSGQITKENMNNLEQVMEQCKGSTDKIANVSAELVTQIKKFSGNGLKKR